jgi:hypothetical protein
MKEKKAAKVSRLLLSSLIDSCETAGGTRFPVSNEGTQPAVKLSLSDAAAEAKYIASIPVLSHSRE